MTEQNHPIYTEVVPKLEALSIEHKVVKSGGGKAARFKRGEYHLHLAGRKSKGIYTLTIRSKTRNTEQALRDFPGSQEPIKPKGNSDRIAIMRMLPLEVIMESIAHCLGSRS